MKEIPMLFNPQMAKALFYERKTQTRRLKFEGSVGDRIWAKETWNLCDYCQSINYRATVNRPNQCSACDESLGKWKPSIFMFRKYARFILEITAIRQEMLQHISDSDARAEGVTVLPSAGIASILINGEMSPAQLEYYALWEGIHGHDSWMANPTVWVITFKVLTSEKPSGAEPAVK